MFWYFVKLLVLLPLLAGMIYGSLWLWRKYQPTMLGAQDDRSIKIIEMLPVGTFGKLAVVEFDGKRLLVSMTRGRIEKLAEGAVVAVEDKDAAADVPPAGYQPRSSYRDSIDRLIDKPESPYRAR